MFSRVLAFASSIASVGLSLVLAAPAEARGPHSPHFRPHHRAQPVSGAGFRHRHAFGHRTHDRRVKSGHGFGFLDGNWWSIPYGGGTVINLHVAEGAGSGVQAVSGIREAPVQRPAIYVIDQRADRIMSQSERRRSSARVIERGDQGQWTEVGSEAAESRNGPLVIRVQVP